MTRSELITKIALKNPNLKQEEIEHIVSVIFSTITAALADGDRVEFRGFGAFSVRQRKARLAKNPRTGEEIRLESHKSVHFKAGKELRDLVDGK